MRCVTLIGFCFLLLNAGQAQAGLFSSKKEGKTAEQLYEDCSRNFQRGYYTKALEICNRVRNLFRDNPVSILAELSVADIYYKRGDFEQSRIAYEDFSRLHPRHQKMDYVSYRIGLSIYKRAPRLAGRDQTSTRQAVNAWAAFDSRFPNSEHLVEVDKLSMKARNRLAMKELHVAKFYAGRKAWGATQQRLEGLLMRYGNTPTAPRATAMLGIAYHQWGMSQQALAMKDRMEKDFPDSKYRSTLNKALSKPAGEKPEESIFVRPYRTPGGAAPQTAG